MAGPIGDARSALEELGAWERENLGGSHARGGLTAGEDYYYVPRESPSPKELLPRILP